MVVMGDMIDVPVDLGDRSYLVAVGHGARSRVASMLPKGAKRVAIVTQVGIPSEYLPHLDGYAVTHHVIGNGETHKSLSTIEKLCSEFAQAGLTRADVVVGVGGGMVTDVAGFAAASYHRGIAVVHVATTLLAMIDAAIGGKTGVNIAEGKNLVGAFWQPHGVACEMDALATLPEREMRCGLGEMAKYHFIAREDFTTLPLLERVARCVEITDENGSWRYRFVYDSEFVTVEKGSITINGTSLTVVDSEDQSFAVCIIPYTYEHTNFHSLAVGDEVNLEFDIIGKYVARLMNR